MAPLVIVLLHVKLLVAVIYVLTYIQSATVANVRSLTRLSLFGTFDLGISKPVELEKIYTPQKKALLPIV